MIFKMSDESLNRNGYKVLTSGIDLNSFLQSPVLLYNHNSDNVIGHWTNVNFVNDTLEGEPVFDEDDDLAIKIKNKVEKGLIKGCSIGFLIKEYEYDEKDECTVVTKSELFETSITPIPANKNAVKLYYKGEKLKFESGKELKLSLDNMNAPAVNSKIDLETLNLDLKSKNEEIEKLSVELNVLKSNNEDLTVELNVLKSNNEKLTEEFTKTNAKFLKLTKEYNDFKVNTFLNEAQRQGQITADEKKEYFKLAQLDLENVKKLINSKPRKNPNPLNKILLNSTEDRSKWTFQDYSKNDPIALLDLRDNDPTTYFKLFKEMQNLTR